VLLNLLKPGLRAGVLMLESGNVSIVAGVRGVVTIFRGRYCFLGVEGDGLFSKVVIFFLWTAGCSC